MVSTEFLARLRPGALLLNTARGQLVDEVKRLVHEGNVRRVVVRQEGRVVAEFPLTVGVVGALAAPAVAAIGALVALPADCRIDVQREGGRAVSRIGGRRWEADGETLEIEYRGETPRWGSGE